MRRVFVSKAGATFHKEKPTLTFSVKKDEIEIIYKIKAGVYIVINFARIEGKHGVLFADWGHYWNRMTNENAQLPKIQKCCPVLYETLIGKDKDGITEMEFGHTDPDPYHGFGISVEMRDDLPIILCLTPDVLNKANLLRTKMLTIYNELVNNPPFPAWKYGLDEIWE